MKIQSLPSRFHRWSLLLTGACLLAFTSITAAMAATPALPGELQKGDTGKMVLLDFYSDFCGTCQMMEPFLKGLASKTENQVRFKRIDLTDSDNQKYLQLYGIEGTPTYVLYNSEGQPLYRMQDYITPVVLERQVLRLIGQLKQTDFPSGLGLPPGHPSSRQTVNRENLDEMILVAFEQSDCKACHDMEPYLKGFEMTDKKGLHIMHVDTDSTNGKKLMETLSIKALPAYVLFDNNTTPGNKADARGELFRMTGKIQPRLLWDIIRMFGDDGV
ncbi:MAG: thiol:disulfide interchange protein [Vampirovibrio sp.]|jgi:thiol-disulfide isomerase/thioredoxin|nr:thiol:disulfide interchange protein [Vampirovibrio sp.]